MRTDRRKFFALGAGLLLGGCSDGGGSPGSVANRAGRVVFVNLEGGFFGLEASDGARFEAQGGLPNDFRQDNLPVRFSGILQEGATSTQWGRLLTLSNIVLL